MQIFIKHSWQILQPSTLPNVEKTSDAYYIKLTNGKYLKWGTNETSGSNETVEAVLNDEDKAFICFSITITASPNAIIAKA